MNGFAPEIAHHAALDARMVIAASDIRLLSLASWPAGREIDFVTDYARGPCRKEKQSRSSGPGQGRDVIATVI